jgi:outer membrane protein TolC
MSTLTVGEGEGYHTKDRYPILPKEEGKRVTRGHRRSVAASLVLGVAFSATAAAGGDTAPAPVTWDLAAVIAAALTNHPAVKQADAEARAAASRLGQAESGYYPQVAGLAGWSLADNTSVVVGDSRVKTAIVQGSVTQLITDFGRTGAVVSRASDLAASAQEGGKATRIEAAFAAEIAYFNVLRAGGLAGVRRETVRQRESLMRQAQAFFDAGLKARIDVVRAEANLYQARADLTGGDHDVHTARLLLLSSMGIDGPTDFQLADAPPALPLVGGLAQWQLEAEENHPELVGLRMQVAAAQNSLRAARLGDNPALAGTARIGWSGDELPLDRSWTVGVQLTIPVFNGFLTAQQTAEAEARLAEANIALDNRRRQIRLLVEDAAQSIEDAREHIQSREKEREAFAENLRLATGRYDAGAGDIIEIIDAQVQMTQAETNLVQARFDFAIAVASLYRATGRIPQP